MALKIPPELKKITVFIRRAEELDRDKAPESRVVAYYCRQHAVQTGIPLATTAAGKACLGEILGQLEGEKQAMSVFSRAESKLICLSLADRVFGKADGEDRAGVAGKGTARTFYAAGSFYEILQQFDDPAGGGEKSPEQEEVDKKRIYCKWKATEILKAIKEGRQPTPGGYGENAADGGGGDGGDTTEKSDVDEAPPMRDATPPSMPAPEPPREEDNVFVPPVMKPVVDHDESDGDQGDEGTEVGLGGTPQPIPPPSYSSAASEPTRGTGGMAASGGESSDQDDEIFVPGPLKDAAASAIGFVDSMMGNGVLGGNEEKTDHRPHTTSPPAPAPVPAPAPASKSSMWGFGKKSSGAKVSKQAMKDALELTKFALSALENKDAELGATRLRQALEALGQ